MAREGNQRKNGLDSHVLNHKKGASRGVLPGMKGHAKGGQVKVFPGEELANGDQPSGLSQNANETSSANEIYNELKSDKFSRKEKQGMVANRDLEEPLFFGSKPGDGSQNTEVPTQEEIGTSPSGNQGQQRIKSRLSCLLNVLHVKSVAEKVELADNKIVRRLRLSVSSNFTAVAEWLTSRSHYLCLLLPSFLKLAIFLE